MQMGPTGTRTVHSKKERGYCIKCQGACSHIIAISAHDVSNTLTERAQVSYMMGDHDRTERAQVSSLIYMIIISVNAAPSFSIRMK